MEKYPEWAALLEVVGSRRDALERKIHGANYVELTSYKFDAGRLAGINETLGIRHVVADIIATERQSRSENGAA